MFERQAKRVYTQRHELHDLYARVIGRGGGPPVPIEGHQLHHLYRRFADDRIGPTISAGKTKHFDVLYEINLGNPGKMTAEAVLKKCEQDYETLFEWFKVTPPRFSLVVACVSESSLDLAFHENCSATTLYCDCSTSPPYDGEYTSALVVAEETEVFEAYQKRGWDCGQSHGEGLSRALASELHPGALDSHAVAPAWLRGGNIDFVNYTYPTDINPLANGCAVLFLNYLHHQLGYGWDRIVAAGAQTLGATYRLLTGLREDPFPGFVALLQRNFPPGQPLKGDNPFPLS
jgi:hypothetical protein